MVLLAAAVSLAGSLLVVPVNALTFVGAVLVSAVSTFVLFWFAKPAGRLLHRWVWAKQGVALQRWLLAFGARRYGAQNLVITGRPERDLRSWQRVLETTALVAGVVALAATLTRVFLPLAATAGLTVLLVLLAYWLTFLVTPIWSFTRLGFRRLDREKFIVTPLARIYGRRTRLADGAFFLIALGVSAALLRHLGQTDVGAYREVVLLALNLGGLAVLVLAHALRHDADAAPQADEVLVAHARKLGFVDARDADDDGLAALLARDASAR